MNDHPTGDPNGGEPPLEERPRSQGLIPHLSPSTRPGYVGDEVPRPRRPTSGLSMVGMTALVYGGMTIAAVALGLLFGGRSIWMHPGHVHEARHLVTHTALGAAAGLAFGLLMVALSRLFTARFDFGKRLHMEFHEVLGSLRTRDAFWMALLSAVGEEALFRGVLQPAVGLWLTAAIFGLVHFPTRRGLLPWPLLAFGMGLAFGLIFEWGGDLGGPIVAHFVINFLNLRHIGRVSYPGYGGGWAPGARPGGDGG
ncbi:MAG: CPBP family intramembrane glutamic endopeptidase [Polyangia bacterium]|nr:CPBP family intramembrane glutamic endopeptidase [Polyangia bacterium]